jgi:hypothetical protein
VPAIRWRMRRVLTVAGPRSRCNGLLTTTLEALPRNRVRVPVPFDPNEAWGTKSEHHVNGTIAGVRVRVTIAQDEAGWSFTLSPSRMRNGTVDLGGDVEVVISPEGLVYRHATRQYSRAGLANCANVGYGRVTTRLNPLKTSASSRSISLSR